MKAKGKVKAVTGTTALIKELIKEEKTPKEIIDKLLPVFLEQGVPEKLAKQRIRGQLYQLKTRMEENETPKEVVVNKDEVSKPKAKHKKKSK